MLEFDEFVALQYSLIRCGPIYLLLSHQFALSQRNSIQQHIHNRIADAYQCRT